MLGSRRECCQCRATLQPQNCRVPKFPDGTFVHNYRVCADQAGCRDRWWSELAYHFELAE